MSKPLTNKKFEDMMKHPDRTLWNRVLECFECTQDQIRKASPYFNNQAWMRVGIQKCIDENFIREFADYIFWYDLPYDSYSLDFIREMKEKVVIDICVIRKTIKPKNDAFFKEYKRETEEYIKKYGRLK